MIASPPGKQLAPLLAPAVIVHSRQQTNQVLALNLPVTLLSPPGAGAYGGAGWWRNIIEPVRHHNPTLAFDDILDCGLSLSYTLAVARYGQKYLIARGAPLLFAEVSGQVGAAGGILWSHPPPALECSLKTPENS